MSQTQPATPAKKKKRSGPIRFEVVVPLVAMVLGIWFYFATMFDGHMRWLLQKGLTYANGAEVNVADFETKFTKASLAIRGIQMTDSEHPESNWLQIGEARYALDWNGLLRAKFVVDDASVIGIGLNVPRKRPGFVLPKEPETKEEGSKSNAVLTAAEDYFKAAGAGTFFDDLASLKSGTDVKKKLQEMRAQLASEKKIQELQSSYNTYEKGWTETQARLQADQEFKQIETDLNALKTKQIKTPQDAVNAVADAEKLKKLTEKKIAEIQALGKQAQEQVRTLDEGVTSLPGLVQADVTSLQQQLRLPDFKVEDLSGVIFGKDVMATVHKALFYYQKGKNLYGMVKTKTPQDKEKEEVPVHERRKGKTYEFPIVHQTFPRFYVKRSELSMYEEGQASTEAVHGVLSHLSSSPSLVPEPVSLKFSGNMSNKGITGIAGEAVFDHRHEDFKESFALSVARIPVAEHLLSQSKEAKILLQKANMALNAKGHITAAAMGFENVVNLQNTAFVTEAEGKDLQRILSGVLGGVSGTQLKMNFGGPWNKLRLDVSSDLGRSLQKAFRAQFDQEMVKVRQDVESYVQGRIGTEKAKLIQEVEKAKAQLAEFEKIYTDRLKSYQDEANRRVEEAKKQLQGKADQAKEEAKDKAEEELKKKLKGFGLPK